MPVQREADVEIEIKKLRDFDLDGLRGHWRTAFGRAAPSHLPKHLLLRLLAYRLQAQAYGDLPRSVTQFLDNLAREKAAAGDTRPVAVELPGNGRLKPGTVLVREHAGQHHHVMVVEEGFAWNGKTYPSLSKVAHAITGTKWNGPRFFGLREATPRGET